MDTIGHFALFLSVGIMGAALFLGPIGRGLARRIEGRHADPEGLDELRARVSELESRSPVTGETDLVAQRLLELEERVDFAERLLTRGRPDQQESDPATPDPAG